MILENVYEKYWNIMPPLARASYIKGDIVYILDETQLPYKMVYLESRNYIDSYNAIKEMRTRAGGQTLTIVNTMVLELRKTKEKEPKEILSHLRMVAEKLGSARPTAPLMKIALKIYGLMEKPIEKRDFEEAEHRVALFVKEYFDRKIGFANHAAEVLEDGYTVLTHCNISGGMVLVGRECRKQGKNISFIATETRPYLQGARLTVWELMEDGFEVKLIPDNMAATVISEGLVDAVIVGSDRCARNGDIANKIGTYQIALAAFEYNIPFYVWVTSVDFETCCGEKIPIEYRREEEVYMLHGKRLYPENIETVYPAFDVTPAKYITAFITSYGIVTPQLAMKHRGLWKIDF